MSRVGFTKFVQITFLIISSLFLHACAPVSNQNGLPADPPIDLAPLVKDTLYKAEIFFWVEIPVNTPPGEIIQIIFLDEVTGLPLHPTQINLHAVDATHYGVAIQAEVGATLKYRFSRQNLDGDTAPEYTLSGNPVRYRMFYVDGPGEVHDLVARWEDTPVERQSGRISGVALDALTNLPVPNMLIFAGGEQVLTNSNGHFLFPALIEGQHMITAYAMNGQYFPFKQNARVLIQAETPTTLHMQPAPIINVTFKVNLPDDTIPSVPVRIAGNLTQLGNTFTDLGGGISVMPAQMPQLEELGDGQYSLTLKLYGGTQLRYTYTQGDGFWNTEQKGAQTASIREIMLPIDQSQIVLSDTVESWAFSGAAPILFDVTVPDYTPAQDRIYIQFRLSEWMAPLPMWPVSENRWAYQLSAPLPVAGETLTYRYCRNGICGDDTALAVENGTRQTTTNSTNLSMIKDTVSEWHLLTPREIATTVLTNEVFPRNPAFIGGLMLSTAYSPAWDAYTINTFIEIRSLNANAVVLTPSWVATSANLPHFTPVLGKSQSWDHLSQDILTAQATGMKAILYPQIQLPTNSEDWWAEVPNSSAGWQVWWEQYRAFILHHADIAQRYNADTLVLGGEWLGLGLPDSREDLPIDLEAHWRKLLSDIRLHYGGKIAWDLPFAEEQSTPPFLDNIDVIYLHWGVPLATWSEATLPEIQSRAALLLEQNVKPLKEETGKPIVLIVDYPSAQGGMTGCIVPATSKACLPFNLLSPVLPDQDLVVLDLQEQVEVYNALLAAVNETPWLDGFISANYFAPVGVEDKSPSIHGKPAEDVLRYWFNQMIID